MKRLLATFIILLTLAACAPPVNLNKTAQTANVYGGYTVAYSEKWVIDIQVGIIAFSNDPQGLEAYLRNSAVAGEQVAGGVFAIPKGGEVTSLDTVLTLYENRLGTVFKNRESFTENARSGLSGIGTQTLNGIVVDVGIAVADIGEAYGVVIYYTTTGKASNAMATIRRMSGTITFLPLGQ